jgi:hypothetical protein
MFGPRRPKTQHGDLARAPKSRSQQAASCRETTGIIGLRSPMTAQTNAAVQFDRAGTRPGDRLFDRDSQLPDQFRDLVQAAGIGLSDSQRQALQALIVAQGGRVIDNDRWCWLAFNDLDDL